MKKRMIIVMLTFALAAASMAGCSGDEKSSGPVLEGSTISKTVSEASKTESSEADKNGQKQASEQSVVKENSQASETSPDAEETKASEVSQESKASEASQKTEGSQTPEPSKTEPSVSVSEIETVGFKGEVKLDHFGFNIDAKSEDVSEGVTLHFKNGFTTDVKVANGWVGSVMTVVLTDTEGNEYGQTFDWSSIAMGTDLKLRGATIVQNSEQTVNIFFNDIAKGTKAKSITINSVGTMGNMNPVKIENKV